MRLFLIPKNNKLYFLHIKKTAGSSLRIIIASHFNSNKVIPQINTPLLANIPDEKVRSFDFIIGHFDITLNRYYQLGHKVVTFLREPISRSYSEFSFWSGNGSYDDDPHRVADLGGLSLLDILDKEDYVRKRSNVQTRSLSGGFFMPDRFFLNSHMLLTLAKKKLEDVFFFGLVEYMRESVDMLNFFMGWRPVSFGVRVNVSEKKYSLDVVEPKALERLREMNHLDLQLYYYSKILFADRYFGFLMILLGYFTARKYVSLPYQEVRPHLEKYLWRRYYKKTKSLKRCHTYTYTFDMPLYGDGWWDREGVNSFTGYVWRWTNTERAEIDLPLRRDVLLELRFHLHAALADITSVYVDNDIPLKMNQVDTYSNTGEQEAVFMVDIPRWGLWKERLSTISFMTTKVVRPCDVETNNKDTRRLGIALDWIQVVPKVP